MTQNTQTSPGKATLVYNTVSSLLSAPVALLGANGLMVLGNSSYAAGSMPMGTAILTWMAAPVLSCIAGSFAIGNLILSRSKRAKTYSAVAAFGAGLSFGASFSSLDDGSGTPFVVVAGGLTAAGIFNLAAAWKNSSPGKKPDNTPSAPPSSKPPRLLA